MHSLSSAILFDCDGVLVDSEVIYNQVELRRLSSIGLSYDPVVYKTRFTGLHGRDFIAEIKADYAALNKGDFPATFEQDMVEEMYRRIETELQAISGIHDLLDRHDGPRAVASSSALTRLKRKLQITGLMSFFDDHVYSGDQVENGKPAPDLFLHAASRLGVPPSSCLVLEDSVNGVRAGRAAGMTVWGFTGGGHADPDLKNRLAGAGASQVVSSFEDMARLLASAA